LVLYSSWPLGLADRLSLVSPPAGAGALLVVAGLAAVVAAVVSLFVED